MHALILPGVTFKFDHSHVFFSFSQVCVALCFVTVFVYMLMVCCGFDHLCEEGLVSSYELCPCTENKKKLLSIGV